jgi:predicted O-methyltransferase YrrM
VVPYRFPAIYGRDLSLETLKEIALSYESGMGENKWAITLRNDGGLEYAFLGEKTLGRPVFDESTTLGQLGCALSHLSILQDAYDSGHETIWVLEDDFKVEQDPHLISQRIKKLDALTQGMWDVLYTDRQHVKKESLPPDACWWIWRPDQNLYDTKRFPERKEVSKDFIEVGSVSGTYSMIIRRSGMEKILNHFKNHRFYLAIDHEIAFPPEMKLYVMSETLVAHRDSPSDIQPSMVTPPVEFGSNPWEVYKKEQLAQLTRFNGWCSEHKGNRLMDFIRQYKPQLCVEIGTFGGSTTFPLAMALEYQGQGQLFTIDSWDNQEVLKGLSYAHPNYSWWKQINLEAVREQFLITLAKMKLSRECTVLHMSSQDAVYKFSDDSIDLLYIDGNFSSTGNLDDVIHYFSKVKRGGYIWLNDASHPSKFPSVTYLMQHAVWMKEDSIGNQCIVFQKT